ncbi:MAG: hypothetical protein Q4C00_08560 [Bacillota bacterium]|nr:hypothetical protein [Bacillota bacterium]
MKILKKNIPCITRKESYKTPGHDGVCNENSNRDEENIAKKLFTQSRDTNGFDHIGKIIDYQTPLKDKNTDKAGKIDLLAFNKSTNTIRVLELKRPDSKDTMLKCVLEGYTYMKICDWKKLKEDFNLPAESTVKSSPLVFVGSVQEKCMFDGNNPQLHKLMELLDIKPFYIYEEKGKYAVKE